MKRLLFLFAFAISMAFTVQAKNEIKTSNNFKAVDIVSTFEAPMIMAVNFEKPVNDVIHFNLKTKNTHESIKTSIHSSSSGVDNYINYNFLQNYQAKYKQNNNLYKGLYNNANKDNRYFGCITQSRYFKTQGNHRQANRNCNYQEIKFSKIKFKASGQYHTSRMLYGRAEGINRIAKRDYKPLQGNKYSERRYYNHSKTLYTKNGKSIGLDWWRNSTTYNNWSYHQIC